MEKDLSIIIVNYKTRKHLKKCLDSILEKITGVNYEIIVINNDKEELRADSVLPATVVNSSRNIGFGAANNLGTTKAKGRHVLFLNPDTILLSKNVREIINKLEKDKGIGVIGPKIINKYGNSQEWSAGSKITLLDLIKNNLGIKKSKAIWESDEQKEADWVSGAAFFVRKSIFNDLSGFDENFFMYFEDIDLCRRVKERDYKVLYLPGVEVRHLGGKSFEGKKEQKDFYYKSQDYYFRKHFGRISEIAVKILRKISLK